MCQISNAGESDLNDLMEPKADLSLGMFRKCLKCEKNSMVVTRINEALCKYFTFTTKFLQKEFY